MQDEHDYKKLEATANILIKTLAMLGIVFSVLGAYVSVKIYKFDDTPKAQDIMLYLLIAADMYILFYICRYWGRLKTILDKLNTKDKNDKRLCD